MEVSKDFEEFFELLNGHKARYLIVGGYAFAIHARPRYTEDIDIWIDIESANARHVLEALNDFGFGDVGISIDDLSSRDKVIQLGYPPLRIDMLTSVSGLDFSDAWPRRVATNYGRQTVYFVGRDDLIVNKKASGRKKDRNDIDELL